MALVVLSLPFMSRALSVMLLLSALGGLLGPFVVTRRLEFLTDALTHTVLPGVVVGFVAAGTTGVFWGALVAALLTAGAVTVLLRSATMRQESTVAVLLTTLFALGVALLSRRSDYAGDLTNFLTGQPLTLSTTDVATVAVSAAVVVAVLATAGHLLYQRAFDPEQFRASGRGLLTADLVTNLLVATTVVSAVRTVGTLLALGVLLLPGVLGTALCETWLGATLTGGLGLAAASTAGLLVSYTASVGSGVQIPPAAAIVLIACLLALLAAAARLARNRIRRTHVA